MFAIVSKSPSLSKSTNPSTPATTAAGVAGSRRERAVVLERRAVQQQLRYERKTGLTPSESIALRDQQVAVEKSRQASLAEQMKALKEQMRSMHRVEVHQQERVALRDKEQELAEQVERNHVLAQRVAQQRQCATNGQDRTEEEQHPRQTITAAIEAIAIENTKGTVTHPTTNRRARNAARQAAKKVADIRNRKPKQTPMSQGSHTIARKQDVKSFLSQEQCQLLESLHVPVHAPVPVPVSLHVSAPPAVPLQLPLPPSAMLPSAMRSYVVSSLSGLSSNAAAKKVLVVPPEPPMPPPLAPSTITRPAPPVLYSSFNNKKQTKQVYLKSALKNTKKSTTNTRSNLLLTKTETETATGAHIVDDGEEEVHVHDEVHEKDEENEDDEEDADDEEDEEDDFFDDPPVQIVKSIRQPASRDRATYASKKRNSVTLFRKVNKLLSTHQQKAEDNVSSKKVQLSPYQKRRMATLTR